jgi:hypothetical protein
LSGVFLDKELIERGEGSSKQEAEAQQQKCAGNQEVVIRLKIENKII